MSPLSSSTLKAASGGRAVTRVAPARAVRQRRAEVRPQLAGLHPQPELGEAAVAEVGALGPAGVARQLAVEEDRDSEAADLRGDRDRLGPGGLGVAGVEPDQGADVERPDRRVGAAVGVHVDRLQRLLGAGGERLGQADGLAGDGEDAAPVVGVDVAVEQAGAAGEGALQAVEQPEVAALRDVGDGEEGRHAPSLSDEQLAAADDRLAVDFDGRFEDDAVEVDRNLDCAADRRRGAEGDVAGTEDLLVLEDVAGQDRLFVGADPELGDVGAVLRRGR